MNSWKIYILRCCDGSLYTGITTDLEKRVTAHNAGKGAKYTRSRRPVELAWSEDCSDHSGALKRELEIKGMTREDKLRMIGE